MKKGLEPYDEETFKLARGEGVSREGSYPFIPEEGPITSTPKKARRGWDAPDESLSMIANDSFMQSLSPEERDYWEKVEDTTDNWMANLPIDLDDETREMIRQQIANDIIDRQQYLKLNPEARKSPEEEFKDLIYQTHRRLGKVLDPEEMKIAIQAGDELMNMMKEVPDTTAHNTSAEQELHQQIKEIISNTLPIEKTDLLPKEQNSLENVIDELADAFIELKFTGGNKDQRNKLKKRIKGEIDKFCNDYLAKYPNETLDREKIHRDLYTALKKVQPPDDVMQSTLEYVKTKDEVEKLVKGLPLEKQSPEDTLKMKRNIGNLAKNILDLERNIKNPDECEKMKKMEIKKFLENLPLKRGHEKNIDEITKQWFGKLKATEKARKVDASSRYSITSDDFIAIKERDTYIYPPCSLTEEDIECLERIRKRACMAPKCLANIIRNKDKGKSFSKSVTREAPADIFEDIGLQTERCPLTHRSSHQCTHNRDIQPQIIIKEYYWDASTSCDRQPMESQMSGSAHRLTRDPIHPCSSPCSRRIVCPKLQSSSCQRNSWEYEEPTMCNKSYQVSGSRLRDYEPSIDGQYPTRDQLKEIRSLDKFKNPIYRAPENNGPCTINIEKGYCDSPTENSESYDERSSSKERKRRNASCEYMYQPNDCISRQCLKKKTCKNRSICRCAIKRQCSKCTGTHIRCPYPSYMYFAS